MTPSFTYRAKFRSNWDGDTVRLDIDLGFGSWIHNQSVRLLDIDAPALRGETLEEARESKEFLQGLLENAEDIVIQTRKSEDDDKYGRWLAYIWADGTLVNQEMIDEGHATCYRA